MKQERILIAEDYNNQLSSNFYFAIRQLRKTLTNEKLGEVGLTLDSNVLRDILSGGNETETKVREKLKEQLLNGYQLPAVKRSNEELAEKLLKDFLIMATKAKSTMSDFRFIPIECFYVDAAKSIELDKQGEIILKEASNLYIDKPEQIEVYKQALKVLDEVKKLGDMADKLDTVPGLEQAVTKLVCLRTYQEQIPQLDLVLTPTGFGVVSNQNLAPASADRVKNLLQQVTNAAEDTYDRCLELLVGTSWADTAQARINIPNLMYTAKQLKMYVDFPSADVHRSKLLEFRTKIYQAEEKIRQHVSAEFFDHILEQARHNAFTKEESAMADYMCKFIGFCIAKNWPAAKSMLERIENYAESKVEVFTSYKDSEAYKVKHFQTYQNEKDDSTYFWG